MKLSGKHELYPSSNQSMTSRERFGGNRSKARILRTSSDRSLEETAETAQFQVASPSASEFVAASHVVIDQPGILEFLAELRDAIEKLLPDFNVTFRTKITHSCEDKSVIETCLVMVAQVDSECPVDRLAATSEEVDDLIAANKSAYVRNAIVVMFGGRI